MSRLRKYHFGGSRFVQVRHRSLPELNNSLVFPAIIIVLSPLESSEDVIKMVSHKTVKVVDQQHSSSQVVVFLTSFSDQLLSKNFFGGAIERSREEKDF